MEEKKSGNSSGENTSNVRMPRRGKKLSPPLGQLKVNNFYTGMWFKSCRKTIFVSCYQGHPTGIFGEISVRKEDRLYLFSNIRLSISTMSLSKLRFSTFS